MSEKEGRIYLTDRYTKLSAVDETLAQHETRIRSVRARVVTMGKSIKRIDGKVGTLTDRQKQIGDRLDLVERDALRQIRELQTDMMGQENWNRITMDQLTEMRKQMEYMVIALGTISVIAVGMMGKAVFG